NPGFWLHEIPSHDAKPEFTVYSNVIIAWRMHGKGDDVHPVTIAGLITDEHDNAIECPDGTCIDDGGTRHATFQDWMSKSKADFDEMLAEDAAGLEGPPP